MSETAKWRDLLGGRIVRDQPQWAEADADYINSLETALAEAQKERDRLRTTHSAECRNCGWDAGGSRLCERCGCNPQQAAEAALDAAEQQLAEVKAQRDKLIDALEVIVNRSDVAAAPVEPTFARLNAIARAALSAHVREPETKAPEGPEQG